jgi:hypothetical protein
MASPVDPFCEHDPGGNCDADDDPRGRSAALPLALRTLAELWARRRDVSLAGLLVRRSFAPGTCFDQAGLHLPDQICIVGQRLGDLRLQPAFAGELIRKPLQLVCCALDFLIGSHFFVGGSSPVSVRQIREAVRRETIVARAAIAP